MQLLDHVSITVADLARAKPFYEAIMAALGEPGLRPDYHTGYFAAFLRDPEGNRVEAVFHHGDREA